MSLQHRNQLIAFAFIMQLFMSFVYDKCAGYYCTGGQICFAEGTGVDLLGRPGHQGGVGGRFDESAPV